MHLLKRFVVTILGVALLAVGLAMMALPGPGVLLLVAGLAVLATEYVWARRLLVKARERAQDVQEAAVSSPMRTAGSVVFGLGILAVGVAALVIDDVPWPVLDDLLDKGWSPVTGSILIVTGAIMLVTTYITIRTAKGQATTHTAEALGGPDSGATRYQPR